MLQLTTFDSAQSAFGGKYFIHWTTDPDKEEFFKFDVVDRDNYNEAWHLACACFHPLPGLSCLSFAVRQPGRVRF